MTSINDECERWEALLCSAIDRRLRRNMEPWLIQRTVHVTELRSATTLDKSPHHQDDHRAHDGPD
jgi:hypothetical protein